VQLRNLLIGGDVVIVIEEERRGVQPTASAMQIGAAVQAVAARLGADVQVRAGGRALLRIIHAGIHADFFDGLRSRAGDRVADRQID